MILINLNITVWSTILLIVCRVLNIFWALWNFCQSLDVLLDFVFFMIFFFLNIIWFGHQKSLNNFLMISLEPNLVNCGCILANLYVRYKTFLQPQGVLQSASIMPSKAKVTSLNLPSSFFLGPNLSKINKKIFFFTNSDHLSG